MGKISLTTVFTEMFRIPWDGDCLEEGAVGFHRLYKIINIILEKLLSNNFASPMAPS